MNKNEFVGALQNAAKEGFDLSSLGWRCGLQSWGKPIHQCWLEGDNHPSVVGQEIVMEIIEETLRNPNKAAKPPRPNSSL